MFKKIAARFAVSVGLASVAVLFVGCADEESYTPQISGVVSGLHHSSGYSSSYSTYKPKTTYTPKYSSSSYKPYKSQSSYQTSSSGYPYGWVPSHASERRWKGIVLHNSATSSGNMATIDSAHRANGWDGVGYDFVIGNGSGSGNGQIEPTFRWTGQKTGAHCKSNSNWANEQTIGICLIGNFNNTKPTSAQMASLTKLVRFLSKRYGIPASKICGHKDVPGHTTATDCPGRYFPMSSFKAGL
jgi:hypothetical protein